MIRLAANLSTMFREYAFLDRIDAAAEAGFAFVECQFPYDHPAEALAARLERCGVEMVLFNVSAGDFAGGDRGFAAIPGRERELCDTVLQAIDYAGTIGVPRLHLLAGRGDPADPAALTAFRGSLAWAAERMTEQGIDLMIEPLNGRDNPGYYLSHYDLAAQVIEALGLPGVRLQFDIYHRQIMHGDVIEGLRRLLPITGHVQVASVPRRAEPGSGELDDFRILAELGRLGFDGFVGCEYIPGAGTRAGLGWIADWRDYEARAVEESSST